LAAALAGSLRDGPLPEAGASRLVDARPLGDPPPVGFADTLLQAREGSVPFQATIVQRILPLEKGEVSMPLEHVPEKWIRFSDKDMLPKFLNWREFFSIR
jgi:hypothetical protein